MGGGGGEIDPPGGFSSTVPKPLTKAETFLLLILTYVSLFAVAFINI